MATKNLARTVIEGGRANSNKFERRYSHKEERADERLFLRRAEIDADVTYSASTPVRRRVYKEFNDKIGPTKRWLEANVGRPWDEVHSDLKAKFDTRTTPGRHVLNDHMLKEVVFAGTPEEESSYRGFVVTPDGVLRLKPEGKRRREPKLPQYRFTHRSWDGLKAWLKWRFIEEHDGKLYWIEACSVRFEACTVWRCSKAHPKEERKEVKAEAREWLKGRDFNGYDQPTKIVTVRYHEVPTGFRKAGKLTEREQQYWKTLHPTWKARILKKEL